MLAEYRLVTEQISDSMLNSQIKNGEAFNSEELLK
jgi:hypothetical protein